MTVAYVAFGSNLGDRLRWLQAAAAALERSAVLQIQARSPVFETDPESGMAQALYLNAVARVGTELDARGLLELCLEVERGLGRQRPAGVFQAPRTIDLDVLLHGEAILDEPGLRIPHPALLSRPFVRVPLAHVAAPGLRHPQTEERLDQAAPSPAVRWFAASF